MLINTMSHLNRDVDKQTLTDSVLTETRRNSGESKVSHIVLNERDPNQMNYGSSEEQNTPHLSETTMNFKLGLLVGPGAFRNILPARLRNRSYLPASPFQRDHSRRWPLPFPQRSVSEEVVIRPLWALIRDLDVWLGRLCPVSARKPGSVCVCVDGEVTCSPDRLCSLNTETLSWSYRFTAQQFEGFEVFTAGDDSVWTMSFHW